MFILNIYFFLFLSGEWKMWTPTFMCGRGLYKSVVGFVGFGRIGQSIAKKLITFGTSKILYSGPRRKLEGLIIILLL